MSLSLKPVNRSVIFAVILIALCLATWATRALQDKRPTNYYKAAGNKIANQYIVLLKENTYKGLERDALEIELERFANRLAEKYNGKVIATYAFINGFAVTLPDQDSAYEICELIEVASVEEANNYSVPRPTTLNQIDSEQELVTVDNITSEQSSILAAINQDNPPQNLDRIDQRGALFNLKYTSKNDGTGVFVYVVDSGIIGSHTDFGTRVLFATDTVGDNQPPGKDCTGHGTKVASLVGGDIIGVAKKTFLNNVRVCGCGGRCASPAILSGFSWIENNQRSLSVNFKPSVLNYSIGGMIDNESPSIVAAINSLISSGITFIGAAGNNSSTAASYTPSTNLNIIAVFIQVRLNNRNV